jgi:hypothetical protein
MKPCTKTVGVFYFVKLKREGKKETSKNKKKKKKEEE